MDEIASTHSSKQIGIYVLAAVIIFLALAVRSISYPVMTDDYIYFIKPWFDTLKSHMQFTAFQTRFSDYAPLYLYFLKALTKLPFSALMSVKKLSVIFDVVLAFTGTMLIRRFRQPRYTMAQLTLVFAIIFAIPTVILNGAVWAQCDVIYASMAIAGLYFMLRGKPLTASIFFGISFALKFQVVFLLPFVIGYFWHKKQLDYVLMIPGVYLVSLIPAWVGGGNIFELLTTYAHQTGEYNALVLSAPSLYAFLDKAPIGEAGRNYLIMGGIALAFIVGLILIFIIKRTQKALTAKRVLLLCLTSALLFPLIMPKMHERYFFLADTLATLYALYNPRRWFVPIIIVGVSFCSYAAYLSKPVPWMSHFVVDFRILAAILAVMCIYIVSETVKAFNEEPHPEADAVLLTESI